MELLLCSNQLSPRPATPWRSQPMASQSTERSFITPRQEPATPADNRSRHGDSGHTPFRQDSSGSLRSTTRYPSTVDTTDRSGFLRFATIFAHCSRLCHTAIVRRSLRVGSGFAVGAVAWSGYAATIPLSLVILLLLAQLETRKRAFGLMVSYYAGATWQIIPGAATFFGHHSNPKANLPVSISVN